MFSTILCYLKDLEFQIDQQQHKQRATNALNKLHTEIINILRKTFKIFEQDGGEVKHKNKINNNSFLVRFFIFNFYLV